MSYERIETEGGVPVKAWTRGVPFADNARAQIQNLARLPFVHGWIAVMPDVHLGKGATVGSVMATRKAIVPAAVGVDIGCGMMAVKTSLSAGDLPDDLGPMRSAIEAAVPHGRTDSGGRNDRGAWGTPPASHDEVWAGLEPRFREIVAKHRRLGHGADRKQLGTLGGGNHFIEVDLDETGAVWIMLHSGSRGVGNRIGSHFIALAQKEMERWFVKLPDRDLAYLAEGSQHFADYVEAVEWAQDYARANRELMMASVIQALRTVPGLPPFEAWLEAVNCHHNYVARERHLGENVLVTRKGAVRARQGDLGIIPGSMGAASFVVRGKGNPESFESCSHGAGRLMSRSAARRTFTVADHEAATRHVECRKDSGVVDETPGAYKPIEAVMAAQEDLVEVVARLHQVVCVKG